MESEGGQAIKYEYIEESMMHLIEEVEAAAATTTTTTTTTKTRNINKIGQSVGRRNERKNEWKKERRELKISIY